MERDLDLRLEVRILRRVGSTGEKELARGPGSEFAFDLSESVVLFDRAAIRSVLVRAPNWVGDLVMATPAFRALRRGFPEAEISLVCRPLAQKILAGAPWFDRILTFDRHGADRGFRGALAHIRALRSSRFDLAILFPNSLSSAFFTWASGCKRRAGYGPGRSLLLSHSLTPAFEGRRRRPQYMADYYGDLLRFLEVDPGEGRLELFVTEEEEHGCRDFLSRHGIEPGDRLLALNPGASFGASKQWLPERFAEVADRLSREKGLRTVILCGPGEEDLAASIAASMKEPCVDTSRDRVGLGVLKPLMRRVSLLVTTDTGTRHFAVAFARPVVVVMGATDPRYTDGNLEKTVVIREPVACSPCHLKVCPIDHRCMVRITADRVVEACGDLLVRVG